MTFQSTIWTTIRQAKQKDTKAVNEFVAKYKEPIISFIKANGFSEHDAEDMAQEIFMRIFRDNVLSKADETRGRFRNFIIAITKNIIKKEKEKAQAAKRCADQPLVSLNQSIEDGGPELKDLITTQQDDEQFDKLWVFNIAKIALNKLRQECDIKGLPYFKAFEMHLKEEASYKAIAEKIDKDIEKVKKYIHRARTRLRDLIKQEIALYSSSQKEYEEELDYLSQFLERK